MPNAILLPQASIEPVEFWVDGYLGEQHDVAVRKTQYPLETGASVVDHALVEPQRVTLNGFVSDVGGSDTGLAGFERAPAAWEQLVELAQKRMPLTLVTLLGTYENMLLVNLSAPVNYQTGRGLKFTASFEELMRITTERGETAQRSGLAQLLSPPLNLGRQQAVPVGAGAGVSLLTT